MLTAALRTNGSATRNWQTEVTARFFVKTSVLMLASILFHSALVTYQKERPGLKVEEEKGLEKGIEAGGMDEVQGDLHLCRRSSRFSRPSGRPTVSPPKGSDAPGPPVSLGRSR